MPDHLHCIWTLPPDDAEFGKRWAMIKRHVTKQCNALLYRGDLMTDSKRRRNESTLWQRRFWEHQIRDETDFQRHMDYIHYNPVKHSLVKRVKDWPHSTFHRYVKNGIYPEDWGGAQETTQDSNFGE